MKLFLFILLLATLGFPANAIDSKYVLNKQFMAVKYSKNPELVESWISRVESDAFDSLPLIKKAISLTLLSKDRVFMFAFLKSILRKNNCPLNKESLFCLQLKNSWKNYFSKVFFFKDSADTYALLKSQINKNLCSVATEKKLDLLMVKESSPVQLVYLKADLYKCMLKHDQSEKLRARADQLLYLQD